MNVIKVAKMLFPQWKVVGCVVTVKNLYNYQRFFISKPSINYSVFSSSTLFRSNYFVANVNQERHYAKDKNKKKSDKGKKAVVDESNFSEVVNVEALRGECQGVVESMKEEFGKQLSLRSVAGSLEELTVTVDGEEFPLREVAQIIRKNPQLIIVNLNALPQYTKIVMDTLQGSGLNLNPQQDGTTIFVPIPKVTKEHREMMAKNAKTLFNKYKDSIRDVQNKFIKDLKKKQGKVSEDDIYNGQQHIMTVTKEYTTLAEKVMEGKQKELLGK